MENYEELKGQLREKRPAQTLSNGAVYDGEWFGENRYGLGVQTWPNGAKYEGNISRNKFSHELR